MWFEIPERKYTHYPRKLAGHHKVQFRDKTGKMRKFRRGSRLRLYLWFPKPALFIDWISYIYAEKVPRKPSKPKAIKTAKALKAAKASKARKVDKLTKLEKKILALEAIAKAKLREQRKWVSAQAVMDDLESRYDNLTYDRQLTGYQYVGRGNYKGSFWHERKIEPFTANSLFMYVVKDVTGYKGDEPTYVVASMHVKWYGSTDEISSKLLKDYTKERVLLQDGSRVFITNQQRLMEMLFGKGGGKDSIVEFVGIKYSKARAPKRKHINPHKRNK